jgi:hypothetical protein
MIDSTISPIEQAVRTYVTAAKTARQAINAWNRDSRHKV